MRTRPAKSPGVPDSHPNRGLVRLVGIANDITERKHHDEELVRAREAADRTKSRFLAN